MKTRSLHLDTRRDKLNTMLTNLWGTNSIEPEQFGLVVNLAETVFGGTITHKKQKRSYRSSVPRGTARRSKVSPHGLTIVQAAKQMKVAPNTVRYYIKKGQLAAQKDGRSLFIKPEDVQSFRAQKTA